MKRLMTILVAAFPLLAMAQKSLEVSVDSVGKLSTKIEEAQRFKIAEYQRTTQWCRHQVAPTDCEPHQDQQKESWRVPCHVHRPL